MFPAIRAELRKLFTTRLWWGMAIGTFIAGAAMAAFFGFVIGQGVSGGPGEETLTGSDAQIANTVYTGGLGISYLLTLTVGILSIGQEYRHQTITSTFLAVPRRVRAMLAKVISLVGIGAFYGIVSLAGSVLVGSLVMRSQGLDPFPNSDVARTLALSLLVLGLWALIGLGAGILMKNQVTAILVAVGAAWIIEPLSGFGLSFLDWGAKIVPYLPSEATGAMVDNLNQNPNVERLDWWGGALMLLGYATVLSVLGIWRTVRRDVT